MNTKKQRKLADSKYNERRAQCEEGLSILNKAGVNIPDLCSLSPAEFEKVGSAIKEPIIYKRVKHCVTEMDRVLKSVEALKADDLLSLGKYLYASHKSLKEDYEVTGLELDSLVDLASKEEGCIGARMTGAGFGGCAIFISEKSKTQYIRENVAKDYENIIGLHLDTYIATPSKGTCKI